MPETYANHRMAFCHALAGAQIKRHVSPTPIIDIKFDRRIGFRRACFGNAFFFQITGDIFIAQPSATVLGAVSMSMDGILGYGANGFKYLDFFVTNGLRIQIGRRFHRN